MKKKIGSFLDLCVLSLRMGHANLLCIVIILSDIVKGKNNNGSIDVYNA